MSSQSKPVNLKNIITIYGRKAVEEALLDNSLNCFRLHLADSNKPAKILDHCISLANKKNIDVLYHDKRKLSFISKNAKQDQGIALDIQADKLGHLEDISTKKHKHLIMLDNVTNPQNVGMIIRSCAAGFIDGIIIPKKGCAELGPLVIKASAGAIFKATIFKCETSKEVLDHLSDYDFASLSLSAKDNFYDTHFDNPTIFIVGNETDGVHPSIEARCNRQLRIPMKNDVESLNVAVTASLIAFHPDLRDF